jgi:hypothetical protein
MNRNKVPQEGRKIESDCNMPKLQRGNLSKLVYTSIRDSLALTDSNLELTSNNDEFHQKEQQTNVDTWSKHLEVGLLHNVHDDATTTGWRANLNTFSSTVHNAHDMNKNKAKCLL